MKTCANKDCLTLHESKKYCSRKCASKADRPNRKNTQKICFVCKNKYTIAVKNKDNIKVCSKNCCITFQLQNGMSHECINNCGKIVANWYKVCSQICAGKVANKAPRHGVARKSPHLKLCQFCKIVETTNTNYCSKECRIESQRKPIEYHIEIRKQRALATKERKNKRQNYVRAEKLSASDRLRMYEAQNGICAIEKCSKEARVLDHCHRTGKIRALLCYTCNNGIGAFDDSVNQLKLAIAYLNKYNG